MAVEAYLPTIGVVVATAILDSINPCAIGVLILMISVLLAKKQSAKRMLILGGLYIFSIFVVYLLAGLGLIYFFASIPLAFAEYVTIGVASLVISAGILEVKDFYWYGLGPSLNIPVYFSKKLDKLAARTTIIGIIILGAFVAAVELPCTGAPYLAIITLLSQYFDATAFWLLVFYNVIFVAPLIVILFMVAGGKKLYEVKKWKQESRGHMRLAIGVMLIVLGWILILIANGTINFG